MLEVEPTGQRMAVRPPAEAETGQAYRFFVIEATSIFVGMQVQERQ